jgi:hypothetical protein
MFATDKNKGFLFYMKETPYLYAVLIKGCHIRYAIELKKAEIIPIEPRTGNAV